MSLVLTTLRVPPGAALQRYEIVRNSVSVGRGQECDWVLPDVDRTLSKIHCLLLKQGGRWFITDISSNGTWINGELLDPGLPRPIHHGERLILGEYEIEIWIQEHTDTDTGPLIDDRTSHLAPRLVGEPPLEPKQEGGAPHHAKGTTSDFQASEENLAAAFMMILTGAGIRGIPPSPASEALRELGRTFHAVVAELRHEVGMVTAATKLQGDQTVRKNEGSNPLRTALTDDDALSMLLGVDHTKSMRASQAIIEALHDLQRHNLAVTRATRLAVEEILAYMAPDRILQGMTASLTDILPGQRLYRGFKAYEALYMRMTENFKGGSNAVFDRAFGRAYESVLAELIATDPSAGEAGSSVTAGNAKLSSRPKTESY